MIENTTYKTYNKYVDTAISSNALSELMVNDHFPYKKKSVYEHLGVNLLLNNFLCNFGIIIDGSTFLLNLDGPHSKVSLKHVSLDWEFIPVENIGILWNLYSWDESKIDIGLKAEASHCMSMIIDTFDKSAELVKHVHGTTEKISHYVSPEHLIVEFRKMHI